MMRELAMLDAAFVVVQDVRAAVEAVRARAGDPEGAHGLEDLMRARVLRAVADGRALHPDECAAEALRSSEIEFDRWYA